MRAWGFSESLGVQLEPGGSVEIQNYCSQESGNSARVDVAWFKILLYMNFVST